MAAIAELTVGPWDVGSNAEYHADRLCVSHTVLEEFRDSVRGYHQVYVLGTRERRPPTEAMLLGSAFDLWLLERDKFRHEVCVVDDRRTKAGRELYRSVLDAGKIPISERQRDLLEPMEEGICANEDAVAFLEAAGKNQAAVRWRDPRTGIWLKCKFDRLLDCGVAIDLKTASDPRPNEWARQAASLGFHRQCALYRDGREGALGLADEKFLHIVVGTEAPHDCVVIELDSPSVELGRAQNNEDLALLKRCRETGIWSGRWANRINSVSLPRYAFYQ